LARTRLGITMETAHRSLVLLTGASGYIEGKILGMFIN
jgi:hypothetical protein